MDRTKCIAEVSVSLGLAGLVVLFGLGTIRTDASDLIGTPRIIDGDTVDIGSTKVRLEGIDAPEIEQQCFDAKAQRWSCGKEARERLMKKVGNKAWTCRASGQDSFGRTRATCRVANQDIGRWMVRSGWALSITDCSHPYQADQQEAQRSQVGLWNGAFIAPLDWRNRNRRTEVLGALGVPATAHWVLLPPTDPPPKVYEVVTARRCRRGVGRN